MIRLVVAALLLPVCAWSGTTFDSELWVSSKTGVGTSSPGARFEARGSSLTTSWFQASGVDLSPAFAVGASGTLGLSTASAARVTVSGSGDSGDLALELRGGDLYPSSGSYQATLGYAGGTLYRHPVKSQHADAVSSNTLTFGLWTGGSSGAVGTRDALTLLTHSTGSTVHVLPPAGAAVSTHAVGLIVSNGTDVGAGTMRCFDEAAPSSALRKEAVEPLGEAVERSAYEEVRSLRHAAFKYKKARRPKVHRGLLYEEAPDSVRAPGGAVSFDRRLLNAELALRELLRELERQEGEVRP